MCFITFLKTNVQALGGDGIYQPGCGIDNLMFAWGHDKYMYSMLVANGTTRRGTAAGEGPWFAVCVFDYLSIRP